MLRPFKFVIPIAVIFFLCSTSFAGDQTDQADWNFSLAPLYLWAVSVDGEVTVRDRSTSLELEFGDIFDNLSAVFTAHFEGWWKQRAGFLFDINYVDLSGEQSVSIFNLDVGFTTQLYELAALYRLVKTGPHSLDSILGLRYSSLDFEVEFKRLSRKIEASKNWTDPMIGARYRWDIKDKWQFYLRGDLAGFGVGSDLTWNLSGLIEFKPWKNVSVGAGYRMMDVDYEDGSGINTFKYDVLMHGPIAGVIINW